MGGMGFCHVNIFISLCSICYFCQSVLVKLLKHSNIQLLIKNMKYMFQQNLRKSGGESGSNLTNMNICFVLCAAFIY